MQRGQRARDLLYISPHLPTSPHISPHLPISPHISPYLATSPWHLVQRGQRVGDLLYISPYLPTSPWHLVQRGQRVGDLLVAVLLEELALQRGERLGPEAAVHEGEKAREAQRRVQRLA